MLFTAYYIVTLVTFDLLLYLFVVVLTPTHANLFRCLFLFSFYFSCLCSVTVKFSRLCFFIKSFRKFNFLFLIVSVVEALMIKLQI